MPHIKALPPDDIFFPVPQQPVEGRIRVAHSPIRFADRNNIVTVLNKEAKRFLQLRYRVGHLVVQWRPFYSRMMAGSGNLLQQSAAFSFLNSTSEFYLPSRTAVSMSLVLVHQIVRVQLYFSGKVQFAFFHGIDFSLYSCDLERPLERDRPR